jgi:hypothetical protein
VRIWSVHPSYLDHKGLVALWREALLAKHVLEGKTKGYTRHPQLIRFRNAPDPLPAINQYLSEVHNEANRRSYRFDGTKIDWNFVPQTLSVTKGQLLYEQRHLLTKLQQRDSKRYLELVNLALFLPHPLFVSSAGDVEPWEISSKS